MKRLVCMCLLAACLLTLFGCSGKDTYIIPAPTGPVTEPTAPTTEPPTTQPPTTQPPTQPPTEPEPGVTELVLTFVGDCTFGRNHQHTLEKSFDEVYAAQGPEYFLEKVRHVFEEGHIS